MKKQIKAYIEKDTEKSGALWLVVDRLKEDENIAHPILPDEVESIMYACMIYLKERGK